MNNKPLKTMMNWLIRVASFIVLAILTGGCRSVPRVFKADYAADYRDGSHVLRRPVLFSQKTDSAVALSLCVFTEGMKPDSMVPGGPVWKFSLLCEFWNPDAREFPEPVTVEVFRPVTSPFLPDTVWLFAAIAAPVQEGCFAVVAVKGLVSGLSVNAWAPVDEPGFPRLLDPDRHFFIEGWLSPNSKAALPAGVRARFCDDCGPAFPRPPFEEAVSDVAQAPGSWIPMEMEQVIKPSQNGGGRNGLLRLTDSAGRLDHYIPVVSQSFPEPSTDADGFWALRYITARPEFTGLLSRGNLMEQLPSLWVSNGLDADRADERANAFWQRISEANQYFTTAVPGSLTDRGMIWIVMGTPDKVWKSHRTETWFFVDPDDGLPLRFDFDYNPSDTEIPLWVLRRRLSYRPAWDRAVDRWRR